MHKISLDDYEIYDSIPVGWKIIEGTTAPNGFLHISNGKSIFDKERKVSLWRIKYEQESIIDPNTQEQKAYIKTEKTEKILKPEEERQIAITLNRLARLKAKEAIVKDILCDLMVCKIEGLDCKEYIEDLKYFIDDIFDTFNKGNVGIEERQKNHEQNKP